MTVFKRYTDIKSKFLEIDTLTKNLTNSRVNQFFSDYNVDIIFTTSEAGFLKIVSWLYVMFQENLCSRNIDFIGQKFNLYGHNQLVYQEFKRLIFSLRTVQQHSLNHKRQSDKKVINECELWFQNTVNLLNPKNENEWEICCHSLLDKLVWLLEAITNTIRGIDSSEFKQVIIEDWLQVTNRYIPIDQYYSILGAVLGNFGLHAIPKRKFMDRYAAKWEVEIKNTTVQDLNEYLGRLIERDVLLDIRSKKIPLPISGNDIMREFSLTPGPKVKEVMEIALDLYITEPCNREMLIKKLHKHIK